ncbi:MAG: hypothetical protein A2170_03535 [Deltaproteobacteria bacterium RBG_13_53_10]|nr:MAG: hypothetical protein A2170_03535 [Deltaproteobacteria bacterium RBG_13_53_10]
MRKHGRVMMALVVSILVVWGVVLSAFGQAKTEETPKEAAALTIARAVVGTGVENSEPTGAAETFPSSTEKVYCFIEATNIPKDTEVTFVWSQAGKEMSKFSLPLKKGSRWRTYAYKNIYGMKGDWKVEIKDADGKLLKDVTFKVE